MQNDSVESVNSNIPIKGEGLVRWFLEDSQGTFRCFLVPCIFIPQCQNRLISTNVCSDALGEYFMCNNAQAKMADDIQQRQRRHLPYRPSVIASRDETSKLWQFLQDQDDFEFKTIEDILNELDSCTAQNECLSETLNTTLATIQSELQRLSSENVQQKSEIEQLLSKTDEQKSEIARLSSENVEQKSELERLSSETDEQNTEI
mgnify:CR=1 FL=1